MLKGPSSHPHSRQEAARNAVDMVQRNEGAAYTRIMGRIDALGVTGNPLQPLTEGYTVVRGALTEDAVEWQAPPDSVTLDLQPGDAVVFHGNTWHVGWRRDIPGLRINLATFMCRQNVLPLEQRGDTRFPEVFERHAHDPRFARLLGARVYSGWSEEGPDKTGLRTEPTGLFD